jgi:hypothetical protein
MRKAAIVLVTVAALTAFGALVAPARAATPATPGRIDTLQGATRAVVMFSWSWRTTRAVVRTYERARPGDRWRLVRGPMPARIGYNGFSANRREGDGTTPTGTFGLVYGFGSQPNPGMRGFSYRRLQPNSCWSGSRADYNRWVTRPLHLRREPVEEPAGRLPTRGGDRLQPPAARLHEGQRHRPARADRRPDGRLRLAPPQGPGGGAALAPPRHPYRHGPAGSLNNL